MNEEGKRESEEKLTGREGQGKRRKG